MSCYTVRTAVVAAAAEAAVLLLPAAVRDRVPNGHVRCWYIESDSSIFLLNQTRFFFDVLLGSAVAFTASICLRPR